MLRPPSNLDLRSWDYRDLEESQCDPHGTPVEILDFPGNVFSTFTSTFDRALFPGSKLELKTQTQVKAMESYDSICALVWSVTALLATR